MQEKGLRQPEQQEQEEQPLTGVEGELEYFKARMLDVQDTLLGKLLQQGDERR
jgi:hypothetical protein